MKQFTIPSVFKAIDQMTQPIKAMMKSVVGFSNKTQEELAKMERRYRSISSTAADVAKKSAIIGLAVLAPLILATREAMAFEDGMADIAKTTGLSGSALENYGNELLSMSGDTRTSIEELQAIGEIGGQLGIAEKDLLGFTDSANKFNVALGKDFSGGVEEATSSVGTISTLFKDARSFSAGDALTKIGSSVNELGAKGSATSANIVEFTKRIGALPDALKPTATDTLALGAYFEEMGISAEIAARGFGDIITTGATNLPKFAKQMGVTAAQAKDLLNSNPAQFAKDFASSFKGLSATDTARILKSLKIGDTGTIKTVGALSTGIERLGFLQDVSNKAFVDGTSLLAEYEKKNNTTAANVAKAQNNLKVFAITAGTLLLPVLNDLVKMIVPILRAFTQFARNNPKTTKTILLLAAGFGVLALIVSAVAFGVKLWADVMLIWAARAKIVTAAQWLWNAAMTANPIGLIIVAIGALILVVVAMIKHWDEWGAALSLVMGPMGFLISMIMSFSRNWDYVKDSFSSGGILAGIKAIGLVIYDAILMPLQQILKIIGDITGSTKVANVAKGIEAYRAGLGVEVSQAINPKANEQDALVNRMESVQTQNVGIKIQDDTGRAKVDPGSGLIPIAMSSTLNF